MNHVDAIRRESEVFHATAAAADPGRPVVNCPGWDVAALVRHLANVHWFWGTVVERRASSPEEAERERPAPPATYPELVAWGREQTQRLLQALETTDDAVPVWTWASRPQDHSVGFIRRYQAQEAAVHRWDVQRAASGQEPDPIDATTASDAIDLFLGVVAPWSITADAPLAGTVHLHCTDTEGEWFVHPDGRVEPIHAKGDVAMRGTASYLLLAIYERVPLEAIDVIGDAALAATFVARCSAE